MALIPNCPRCNKPLPTRMETEQRLTRVLTYTVLDDERITLVNGRRLHRECARTPEIQPLLQE